jgi:hypothetical protein
MIHGPRKCSCLGGYCYYCPKKAEQGKQKRRDRVVINATNPNFKLVKPRKKKV